MNLGLYKIGLMQHKIKRLGVQVSMDEADTDLTLVIVTVCLYYQIGNE